MVGRGELGRGAPVVRAALVAGLAACAGCIASYQTVPGVDTQRHPEPMRTPDELPPGISERWLAGPEVVQVVRHSDPVYVVRPGIDSSYPLSFWDKSARVSTGSGVRVEAGGRAEVDWDHGTRLVLFGPTTGVLGSHSRGEPAFVFGELERAVLYPAQAEELWLVGGARLSALAGPVVVEKVGEQVLRVHNQSGSLLVARYRDELVELDPGQLVDLPLLRESTAPYGSTLGWRELSGLGFGARVAGEAALAVGPGALRVEAHEPLELEALGVRVSLAPGESALLARPGAPAPSAPAPSGATAPSAPAPSEAAPEARPAAEDPMQGAQDAPSHEEPAPQAGEERR